MTNIITQKQKEKLNLGCGDKTPSQWINVDYSLGATLNKLPMFPVINSRFKIFNIDWNPNILIHDLRSRFPWKDNSIDVVYCSHTLEHFDKVDGQCFLQECYRVLKQDGIIRIIVPDLSHITSEYNNGKLSADDFVDRLGVANKTNQGNILKRVVASLTNFPHLCMYDSKSLTRTMSDIGFVCQARDPFDSHIEDIEVIEDKGRTINSVIVEGKK